MMEINVSDYPAAKAADYISERLSEGHKNILVLLSGGSSLDVLYTVSELNLGPRVTFMMADERYTDDPAGSNYFQFTKTDLFATAKGRHAMVIELIINTEKMSHSDTALSMQRTLEYFFKVQEDCYVIALLGVGSDGHFASIFPQPDKEVFAKNYLSNQLFITSNSPTSEFPERLTITPYFLKNYVDDVVLYASGEDKCDHILIDLMKNEKQIHELPALLPANHPNAHLFTDCVKIADPK